MNKFDRILLIIASLCIFDTFAVLYLKAGMNLGNILPFIIGIFIFIYIALRRTRFYKSGKPLVKKLEQIVIWAFAIWFISFIIVLSILVTSSISNKNESTDCVIVLGAGLHGDIPSLVLLERLNLALDYVKHNKTAKLIVSGGQGAGETITEAEAMKRYLVKNGIPEENILKEEKSTSTMENLIFSKKAFKEDFGRELQKITIITSDFHMFRSKMLAHRVGLDAYGISAQTPFYIYPNVFAREYFALIKSIIFDKVSF